MTIRLYLLPIETGTYLGRSVRGPAYFAFPGDPTPPALVEARWEMRDYGFEPVALLAADVTPEQHDLLAAQLDVAAIPEDLNRIVGSGALATVQAELETRGLPGDAVTSGTTYRAIVRGILAIFALSQRYGVLTGGERLLPAGIDLDTQLSAMSAENRQALIQACDELGYDRTEITLSSTIRDCLKKIAQQTARTSMLGLTI
jgi:hypothetical protein